MDSRFIKSVISILSDNSRISDIYCAQLYLELHDARHDQLRVGDLVRLRAEVVEHAAVHAVHGRVLGAVLQHLRLGDPQDAAEVHRPHRDL